MKNTFNLRETQNDLAFAQAFGKTATYAMAEAAGTLAKSSPEVFGEGKPGRDVMHAAVAAIGAAISGGNIAGAVGGSLTGDALTALAKPIIDQAVSGLPPGSQEAARNALNVVVATAGGAAAGSLAGGSQGALAGGGASSNNEIYNRQLHEPEKTKAQQIAATAKAQGLTNADGSPITAAQIENAMRGASNSQYGETAAQGVVVPLNSNTPASALYDTTGMKLVTDSTGNYLMQDPSMLATPLNALQDLITQNTGGASSPYSWGTSTSQATAPKIDPYGPFSPSWNAGDYSAGFGEYGRGLAPDYVTASIGALSGNASGIVNLYNGATYVSGGVAMTNPGAVSYKPSIATTVGYIFGANSAQDAHNFIAGDGNQAFISIPTPFGVNAIGAITHAYGGSTAIEFGMSPPASFSFGVMPWGHGAQITGSK